MLQPENQSKKYNHLFTDIDTGRMKIPQFQREFVWSDTQTAKLIDSIIKGFPIGTFILWKTREELRSIKQIGNLELPDPPRGDAILYVLDGQQRITSLYAVRKGLRVTKDGREIDYGNIAIDLSCDPDEEEEVVTVNRQGGNSSISVHKLLTASVWELAKDHSSEELERIDIYRSRLTGYDFSTILISEYPIDTAVEVFTRINTGGTQLTLFEIMVAKTFDQERDFDLAREYDWLIDNKGAAKDLEDVDFDTIPAATVLQCIAAYIDQQVRRQDILKLDKTEFIDSWPTVKDGIFAAVDYVRGYLRIPVSQLLPYNALLVPLTYFFIRNGGNPPSPRQHKLLTQYVYWASLSRRFSSGTEGKIALDLRRMDDILTEQAPSYRGDEISLTMEDVKWRWFSTGDAFCRAILCLYAFWEPKSFASNHMVRIDNGWLKQANSRNYHHFFPRHYLKRAGIPDWKANSILNITIVDDYLNKRKIRANPPSDYMGDFAAENPDIANTMSTHLIGDLDAYGIWGDDYEAFIEHRGQQVLEELNQRLNPAL